MIGIDRYHWNLARAFFAISSFWAIVGVCSNFAILVTTVKTRSLRSTCNVLIAICAVADIFHQLGVLVKSPMVLDIYLEIDSDLCIAIMFLPELGVGIGCVCILCVGLDRMISVILPIQYLSINKCFYACIICFLMVGYSAYQCGLMIYFRRPQQVVCDILSPYPDEGVILFLGALILINLSTVLVYTITGIALRMSEITTTSMKRLQRSLFIVMCVDVSGWLLTPGLIEMLHGLGLDEQQMFAFTYLSTSFINIALASKFFIYYATSSDYRAAFRSVLLRKGSSSVSIGPSNFESKKTRSFSVRRSTTER